MPGVFHFPLPVAREMKGGYPECSGRINTETSLTFYGLTKSKEIFHSSW
jgi:hypothetical protein